jgi:hypothetical protein
MCVPLRASLLAAPGGPVMRHNTHKVSMEVELYDIRPIPPSDTLAHTHKRANHGIQ